ncbi:MAG: helix-turn-helix domain-containing protein [Rickettsiales bacterium]|jgi:transcriptional regulator with XRE-family HTH domain|nr:helix-turn-helix domain-containing protein [Rickettsiales bacterium]
MNYIEKLNSKKKKEHFSLRTLSDSCDISADALKNILAEKSSPKVSTLQKICNALDISLAQLFCSENEVVINIDTKTSDFFRAFERLSDESKSHIRWLVKKLSGR